MPHIIFVRLIVSDNSILFFFRSLLPIIRCVDYHDDRVALWGVWALANFCQIDSEFLLINTLWYFVSSVIKSLCLLIKSPKLPANLLLESKL